jgi:coproporphyrinogen III oxidase
MNQTISKAFRELQLTICNQLEQLDGKGRFQEDSWTREGGGGGKSRIINGAIIEKGGVNYSEVYGKMSPSIAHKLEMEGGEFFATGVSIVLHPMNPFVPIIHMNIRFFQMKNSWWFGGGIDLTPHYIFEDLAIQFHNNLKNVCDRFDPSFYINFKNWADKYFNIKHRKESRGVGGIFYDRLNSSSGLDLNKLFDFSLTLGEAFFPIYQEQVQANISKSYDAINLEWMNFRRSRYAEFNLVWDRGTKFGLETDGRAESILMSLPPKAEWSYGFSPKEGSQEMHTLDLLKKQSIDWLKLEGESH